MRHILLLITLILLPSLAFGWPGKVIKISDGDTLTVLTEDNKQVRVRLFGIDAPESGQDYGKKAADFVKGQTALQTVDVQEMDVDRYGRIVGKITLPNGRLLNAEIVAHGWAWVYRQYCKTAECGAWLQLEERARSQQVGLWQDKNPTPPWEWRKGNREGGQSNRKESAQQAPYHGNIKSNVFHAPGCRHYDCSNCTAQFSSREEAVKAGYRPCGVCKP